MSGHGRRPSCPNDATEKSRQYGKNVEQKPTWQRELSEKNIFGMKKETEWVKKEKIHTVIDVIVEVSVICRMKWILCGKKLINFMNYVQEYTQRSLKIDGTISAFGTSH